MDKLIGGLFYGRELDGSDGWNRLKPVESTRDLTTQRVIQRVSFKVTLVSLELHLGIFSVPRILGFDTKHVRLRLNVNDISASLRNKNHHQVSSAFKFRCKSSVFQILWYFFTSKDAWTHDCWCPTMSNICLDFGAWDDSPMTFLYVSANFTGRGGWRSCCPYSRHDKRRPVFHGQGRRPCGYYWELQMIRSHERNIYYSEAVFDGMG